MATVSLTAAEQAALTHVANGEQFVLAQSPESLVRLFLWYDPTPAAADDPLGILYYSDSSDNRAKSADNGLPLSRLSNLTLGLDASFPAGVEDKQCFILEAGAIRLSLINETGEARDAFLQALDTVMQASRRAAAAGAAPPQPQAPVAAAVEAPVTAPVEEPKPQLPSATPTPAAAATTTATTTPVTSAPASPTNGSTKPPLPTNDKTGLKGNTGGAAATSSPPTPAPSSSSNDDPISYVIKSRRFTYYYIQGDSDRVEKRAISLFYEPDGNKLGSLYWCEPNQRVLNEATKLHVNRISDVFLGKQTPVMAQPIAAAAPADRCLTVATARLQLNLEAESAQERDLWLTGFKAIFTTSGKKVVDDTAKAAPRPAQTPEQERQDFLRTMVAGADFIAYFPPDTTTVLSSDGKGMNDVYHGYKVSVFFDPLADKLGTLYWCKQGLREKAAKSCIPLHLVSDLYLAKQTKPFQSQSAASADKMCCFSIISRERELHLQAPTERDRNQWLLGIHEQLISSGKKVVENKRSVAAPASGGTATTSTAAAQPASVSPMTEAEMRQGLVFDFWYPTGTGASTRRPYLIFYHVEDDSRLGSFYWCEPDQRKLIPENALPLASVTDMYLGKQQDVLKTPQAKDIPAQLCCSIVAPSKALHLQAPTPEKRDAWLFGLTSLLKAHAKRLDDAKAAAAATAAGGTGPKPLPAAAIATNQQPLPAATAGAVPATAAAAKKTAAPLPVSPGGSNSSMNDAVAATEAALTKSQMSSRTRFTLYSTGLNGSVQSSQVEVYYRNDHQALYWVTGFTEKRMLLEAISEIKLGKQTTIFASAAAARADQSRCISVISKDQELHLEAESMEKRDVWCAGLQAILADVGKQTEVDDQEVDDAPTAVAARNEARRPAILAPSQEALTKLVSNGARVTIYRGDRRTDALLFYATRPQDGACGTLYWNDYGSRTRDPDASPAGLSLSMITTVLLGKQTRDFVNPAARDAVEERCISLLTSNGQELNIEATTVEQMNTWLFAIQRILVAAGREIVLDEDGKVRGQRRFSVNARATGLRTTQLSISADLIYSMMVTGFLFTLYTEYNSGSVRITFDPRTKELVWSNADGKRVGAVPLVEIGEVFVGKQSLLLKQKGTADPLLCATLVTRGNQVNIEAKSEEQLCAWLLGVSRLLSDNNRVVLPSDDGTRFTVSLEDRSATSNEGKDASAARILRILEKGQKFTSYAKKGPRSIRTDVFVFYRDDDDGGALYLALPGQSATPADAKPIPLEDIVSLRGGKTTAVLKELAAKTDADRCFTIVAKDGLTVDLEAPSMEIVVAWSTAIDTLLSKRDAAAR